MLMLGPDLSVKVTTQRHTQFDPQAIRLIGESQQAAAALDNGLHDGQAQTGTFAGALPPEALGDKAQLFLGDAAAVIPHLKACQAR